MAPSDPPLPKLTPMVTSGTWDWDIQAATLRADAAFAELYGLEPEAMVSGVPTAHFFGAIHPDDRARIRIAVAGILAGAEIFSKEYRIVAPDGGILWVHARGQGHHGDDGQAFRFTGLLIDVTERKRAEEWLRVAQSAGGVGTFEYIDGYATVTVSEEFCRLLGFHPTSVLPLQTINGVVHEGEPPLIPDVRNGVAPESLEAVFFIARNDDGSERWIARRGEVRQEGAGFRLIGVIYDVTTAKEQEAQLRELNETLESRVRAEVASRQVAEEALRQSQKMEAIGQLTGGIAHDFNNLLMAISSSLTLLRKRLPEEPSWYRFIDQALEGTQRGAALTQRMLAFARRQDLQPEPLDVKALVEGMSGLVERTLGPAWPLRFEIPSGLPLIVADGNQLELAILNLAVNARDAMPDGGEIQVMVSDQDVMRDTVHGLVPGRYLKLAVVDRGLGMDEDTLKRATEPFFTTKGIGKGTGLGLSMIHGLASQLEGTFTLESKPGEGTTATLWLPTADSEATVSTPGRVEEPAPRQGQLKILAVDDDPLILMNTSDLLEDLGHHVFEAGSGQEALAIVRAHDDLDLLITDQAMPGMTGVELAESATDIRPELAMILATGYGELPKGARASMIKLGKPFSQEDLAQAIAKVLGAK